MKIIVGALSGWQYPDRRRRCRETWIPKLQALGHDAMFLIGASQSPPDTAIHGAMMPELAGDLLCLPCPNHYETLTQRTRTWCYWLLGRDDWTWAFKCDDDTYICAERLDSLAREYDPGRAWYIGAEWKVGVNYASGGAGYFLARRGVELVADQLRVLSGAEDLEVGNIIRANGIKFHIDQRLIPYGNEVDRPLPGNQIAAAHQFPAELMIDCHMQLYPGDSSPEFSAR